MSNFIICKSNTISVFLVITIAAAIYCIMIMKLGGISEDELFGLPEGKMIFGFAKRLRIL